MGIDDEGKIEAHLAHNVCPSAFYHRLPDNFNARLVQLDQTAIVCSAFQMTSVRTANDFHRALQTQISRFFQAEEGISSDATVAERDSDDGCTSAMRIFAPHKVPSLDDLIKDSSRDGEKTNGTVRLTRDARIRLSEDDSRYTPSIRTMLHNKRYNGARQGMNDEVLAKLKGRILGGHPLVGYRLPEKSEGELGALSDLGTIRRQAYGNQCVRRALRLYTPMVIAAHIVRSNDTGTRSKGDRSLTSIAEKRLRKWRKRFNKYEEVVLHIRRAARLRKEGSVAEAEALEEEMARTLINPPIKPQPLPDEIDKAGGAHNIQGNHGDACQQRRLIIDGVALRFDLDTYARSTLDTIPDSLYREARESSRTLTLVPSSGKVIDVAESPMIGECDLKIVHDILTYSDSGDDVLVINRDSDIPHILLQNMHRFIGRDGSLNRRIFLDMGFSNMKSERLERRFVCLNRLYLGIIDYGARIWGLNTPDLANNALAIITGAALFCGSDYTARLAGLGPAKIMATLTNDALMKAIAKDALRYLPEEAAHDNSGSERGNDAQHRPVLSVFGNNFVRVFAGQTVINALPAAMRRILNQQPFQLQHDWTVMKRMYRERNSKGKFQLPEFEAVQALWRRISWSLNYFANAPCAIGAFPSPLWQHNDEQSLWGWTRALASHVSGTGTKCHFQLHSLPEVNFNGDQEPPDVSAGVVACHDRVVSNELEPLIAALAEFRERSQVKDSPSPPFLPHLEVKPLKLAGLF